MAHVLTVRGIEKASPRAARYEIPDALITGLRLVVQPSGARSFVVRYRTRNREQRKLTLGPFLGSRAVPLPDGTQPVPGMAMTLGEARQAARVALAAVAEGRDPAGEKGAAKVAVRSGHAGRDTFGVIARQFITRHSKPKNKSWREQARYLGLRPDPHDPDKLLTIKGGLVDRWGDRNLGDIRKRDIIDELDTQVDRAPIAANRWLSHVKRLFGWAVARDLIEVSPCTGVTRPAPERSRERILSDIELRLVWLAADRLAYPLGPWVKMLVLTGQRRVEVAGLPWSEIDLDRALWALPAERVKNGRPHTMPLSTAALTVLAGVPRIAGQGFVFSHNGRSHVISFSLAKQKLNAAMAEIAVEQGAAAAIAPWVFHDLRRTMVSGMARLGVALPTIERSVNHLSGSFAGVIGVYQRHDFQPEMRAAFEVWGRFVLGLVEGQPDNVVSLQATRA